MVITFETMNPEELVALLVAIGGVIPIIVYRRRLSRWLLIPYGFLLLGVIMTNVEHLIWEGQLNYLEHGIGNLGAGIGLVVFAYIGYIRLNDEKPSADGIE